MPIVRCALSLITGKGLAHTPPAISALTIEETTFLERHVQELRNEVRTSDARGKYLDDSLLPQQIALATSGTDDEFVEVVDAWASQLAAAMRSVRTSDTCLVAVVHQDDGVLGQGISFLKLDAEIEAAQLEELEGGTIRLHVFEDLLPRPGDIQKGFSWPDPRSPDSDIVILDKVRAGSATKYFQRAVGIEASPNSRDTESALADALASLGPDELQGALQAIGTGGVGERVAERIQAAVPSFREVPDALGGHGRVPGFVRPTFGMAVKRDFSADGIDLAVPLDQLSQVRTVATANGYITTIQTTSPLTPISQGDGGDG